MMLFIEAISISLFLREYVGFCSITRSKVSPMMATSMLRNVICEMNVVETNIAQSNAVYACA